MTLKGFQRVNIAVGKIGEVVIDLPYSSFEFYDRSSGKKVVIPGDYEIFCGNSSDNKDLKKLIKHWDNRLISNI